MALVRQKSIALLLGPGGYGILAFIRNVCDLFITLPLMGLDGSSVRFISSHNRAGDRDGVRRVMASALTVALTLPICFMALYMLYAPRHLASAGFDARYVLPMRVAMLSAPLMSVSAMLNAFLIGFKQVRLASLLIVVCSFLTLMVGVPLIVAASFWGMAAPFFEILVAWRPSLLPGLMSAFPGLVDRAAYAGVWGAVAGLVALGGLNAALSGWFLTRIFPLSLRGFSLATLARMRSVAFGSWLGASFALLALLVVKSHLNRAYDEEVLGLYNTIYVMCAQYLGPLAHSLIFYTYPRMSELSQPDEINAEINSTLRVVLLLSTPAMVLMVLAVRPLLLVLYTSRFLAAAPLMPLQMMGEWFRLPMRSFGMALMSQERMRPYIFFDMLFYAILIAVTVLGGSFFEITHLERTLTLAPCAGYALGAMVGAAGYYWFARRIFAYRLGAGNRSLLLASMALMAIALFVPAGQGALAGWITTGKILLLGLWAWVVVDRKEWQSLWEIVHRRLLAR